MTTSCFSEVGHALLKFVHYTLVALQADGWAIHRNTLVSATAEWFCSATADSRAYLRWGRLLAFGYIILAVRSVATVAAVAFDVWPPAFDLLFASAFDVPPSISAGRFLFLNSKVRASFA